MKKLLFAAVVLGLLFAPLSASYAGEAKSGNTLAVCGCGMVFTPDEHTKHVTANGKTYACCSDQCHEMASKNPEKVAQMAEANFAKLTEKASMDVAVANVLAVTEKGTEAVCGCGKHFSVDASTPFLKAGGESYACCGKECHEMASKDPEAAVKMIKKQMAAK